MRPFVCILTVVCATSAAAQQFALPQGSQIVIDQVQSPDSYTLPIGVFDGTNVPATEITGRVRWRVARLSSPTLTTQQILEPLAEAVQNAGFETVLNCKSETCGGFDFRFGIEVQPAPDMHVDLTDFRFLSARRGQDAVSLLVSRSQTAGFVQIVSVTATEAADLQIEAEYVVVPLPRTEPVGTDVSFRDRLTSDGFAILPGLAFEVGSARLGAGPFESLQMLADYLSENPGARVILVGHTDASGDRDANLSLSRARAGSVRDRLTESYGVAAGQIEADGVGVLAPVASNATADGREANRRVEVVLLGTN